MEHEGGIDTQEQGAAVEWGALHGGGERQGPQDGPGHGRGGLLAYSLSYKMSLNLCTSIVSLRLYKPTGWLSLSIWIKFAVEQQ